MDQTNSDIVVCPSCGYTVSVRIPHYCNTDNNYGVKNDPFGWRTFGTTANYTNWLKHNLNIKRPTSNHLPDIV